jgi:hypothetical protein
MTARNKQSAYIFIILEERNGEYEYCHKSVHELADDNRTAMKNYVNRYVKEFYGGKAEKGDGGYYFFGGEVYVRVSSYGIISREEYVVLNRYL